MVDGLLGRKVGMTNVFADNGALVPVTVVLVETNYVSQVKTVENDGYNAVQLTAGKKKLSKVGQPLKGHFAKAQVEPGDMVQEFLASSEEEIELGKGFALQDIFAEGQYVDVTGTSKGKGFAGTVKRHNFRTQDASHGNSRSHRVPGSIGQNQTPGKVFKGKKMAGHLGNAKCTTQSLKIVKIDQERNVVLIHGAVPGAPGSAVRVSHAVKMKKEAK